MSNTQTTSPKCGRPRGPSKTRTTLWLQPEAKAAAQKAAFRRNLSLAQLFEEYIRREYAAYLPAEETAMPAERATA